MTEYINRGKQIFITTKILIQSIEIFDLKFKSKQPEHPEIDLIKVQIGGLMDFKKQIDTCISNPNL